MDRRLENQAEAGPSRVRGHREAYRVPLPEPLASDPSLELITIPSYGLEYFHYRRSLFLSGLKPYPLPNPLPEYITVPKPPPPIPYHPLPRGKESKSKESASKRLEEMLEAPGSQGDLHVRKRVMEVERVMKSGRKLVKGTTLDFVIKILKYGWIQDGLWPIDSKTGQPAIPPDSPPQTNLPLPEASNDTKTRPKA